MERDKNGTAQHPEIIWVFGSHDRVAVRSAIRGLHGEPHIQKAFRSELGISENGLVIPIWPESKHRFELAKKIAADEYSSRCVILMVGELEDLEDPEIKEFSNCRALFYHPRSRQFFIDTGVSSGYSEYTEKAEKIKEKLAEIFDFEADADEGIQSS